MEAPLMEGGIARLQIRIDEIGSPSRLFGLGIGSMWRLGGLLLLAAIAAYGSLITRLRLLARFPPRSSSFSSIPPVHQIDGEDEAAWSSCSSEEDGDEEEIDEEEEEEEEKVVREGYFGDFGECRWRDDGYGREIVQSWKDEDAELVPCRDDGSLWDFGSGGVVRPFGGRVEVRVWDERIGGDSPAASGTFSLRHRHVGRDGKLLFAGHVAAVDLRKLRSPRSPPPSTAATGGAIWYDLAGFRPEISRSTSAFR